jgi:hypothetical protein
VLYPLPDPALISNIGEGARFDNHRRAKRVCAGIQARMPVFLPEEYHDRLSGEAGKDVVVPLPTGRKEAAKTLWNRLRSGTNLSMPIYSESRAFPSVHSEIPVFVKNITKLRKCSDTGLKAGKLDQP